MQPAAWLKYMGRHVSQNPRFWAKCSDIETRIIHDALEPIQTPIYITGLARSGSTILLELLNQHPDTHSLQYGDFPFIYTPWLWSHFTRHAQEETRVERAHQDGIHISSKSPEAMEEPLWMHAFPDCHNPNQDHLLSTHTQHPAFEKSYQHIIQKLLLAHHKQRYLAKANYHVCRIPYLLKLLPDARFIIPIRHPNQHVASLIRQHTLFTKMQQEDSYVLTHLRQVGHFEFGLDRRPINLGSTHTAQAILDAWQQGDHITGYALQWQHIYHYIANLLDNPTYQQSLLLVPLEELCQTPKTMLERILAHTKLTTLPTWLQQASQSVTSPSHTTNLTAHEQSIIHTITHQTAQRLGYDTILTKKL